MNANEIITGVIIPVVLIIITTSCRNPTMRIAKEKFPHNISSTIVCINDITTPPLLSYNDLQKLKFAI